MYNAQAYVRDAIQSILQQSYSDFEFIVVDDGSTDGSAELVREICDDRIHMVSQSNRGLAVALNRALSVSVGRYIARMDADDISASDRFSQQVALLDAMADVAIVGTSFDVIDELGNRLETFWALPHDDDIKRQILTENPFGHGSVMIRREVVRSVGGYRPVPIEDYDLWLRVLREYRGANLPDVLYRWRVNPAGMSHGSSAARTRSLRELVRSVDLSIAGRPPAYRAARGRLRDYEKLDEIYDGQFARKYLSTLYASGICLMQRKGKRVGLSLIICGFALRPRSIGTCVRLYIRGTAAGAYRLDPSIGRVVTRLSATVDRVWRAWRGRRAA